MISCAGELCLAGEDIAPFETSVGRDAALRALSGGEIVEVVRESMNQSWAWPGQWCVGRGSDARRALFDVHHVREKGDRWVYCRAASAKDAEEAVGFFATSFLWRAKCDVDPLGTGVEVYAFLKGR